MSKSNVVFLSQDNLANRTIVLATRDHKGEDIFSVIKPEWVKVDELLSIIDKCSENEGNQPSTPEIRNNKVSATYRKVFSHELMFQVSCKYCKYGSVIKSNDNTDDCFQCKLYPGFDLKYGDGGNCGLYERKEG